jgi:hypothetical protein
MVRSGSILLAAAAVLLMPVAAAQADDWKDESGKGRFRGGDRGSITVEIPLGPAAPPGRYYGPPPGYYYGQPMPHGHLPPPGECRVWFPDRPPGQQPPPYRC